MIDKQVAMIEELYKKWGKWGRKAEFATDMFRLLNVAEEEFIEQVSKVFDEKHAPTIHN